MPRSPRHSPFGFLFGALMVATAACPATTSRDPGTGGRPALDGGGGGTGGGGRGGAPGGGSGTGANGSGGNPAPGATGGAGTDASTGGGGSIGDAGAPDERAGGGNGGGGVSGSGAAGAATGGGGAVPDASVIDAPSSDAVSATDGGGPGNGPSFGSGPVVRSTVHQDIGVHDPTMIWDGKRYYLFGTGSAATIRTSTNLSQWTNAGRFSNGVPAWIPTTIGQTPDRNTPWAPDISYFNGRFHLYYSASVFGRNTSAIGLATTPTLDPAAPGYGWVDQGLVVQTRATDDHNAIDPNVAFDATGVPWLSFGSFWSGIKLRRLDPATGKLALDDPTVHAIASRGGGAIEAPSIISHNGFYYLFVSFDVCCQGASSTYRTMAGRATAITGPYVDKAGRSMMQSGGDQLLTTSGRYIGPGGGSAWKNGDNYLYVYHYYDGQAGGASKLSIRPITFTADDWIILGEPLFP